MDELKQREESNGTDQKETKSRTLQSNQHDHNAVDPKHQAHYLGCLSKQQLTLICASAGLTLLLIIIVTALVLTTKSASSVDSFSFPTDGDMLDFLVQSGKMSHPDGLLATWFHRANRKEEMNKALTSDAMILEADVTLEGYGTPNMKPVPIMAHPPNVYSDNTLDQWLDAVLASTKAIKLDFKSLASVGFSLDILSQKNMSKGINRPVWLNADILRGPNTPGFVSPVNGSRFLQLIEERFPDVTLSPGWMVLYVPPLLTQTYSRRMMEDMYDMIKDVRQKVTFPIYTVLARRGWQHISWLLSQSSRFSLTLWQDSVQPNISDLLFIRDNSHPARVYYDIYEPTLSAFKEAARQPGRVRRFYPGGELMEFLHPVQSSDSSFHSTNKQQNSLAVRWFTVTNRTSLLTLLSGDAAGVLLVRVTSDSNQPGVPVVESSGGPSEVLMLQDILQLLGQRADVPLALHLHVPTHQLLETSLTLLKSSYSRDQLFRPVWISMEASHSTRDIEGFVAAVESLFPYVTLVLSQQTWPPVIPAAVPALSQRVALHLNTASLHKGPDMFSSLMDLMDRYDVIVEEDTNTSRDFEVYEDVVTQHAQRTNTNLYVISAGTRLMRDV